MKYGLIGEKLGHSFSKEIHEQIENYTYTLCELSPDELDSFMKKRDFAAINVTIPYKEKVIPYLDHISERAKSIGAVNTIVNKRKFKIAAIVSDSSHILKDLFKTFGDKPIV